MEKTLIDQVLRRYANESSITKGRELYQESRVHLDDIIDIDDDEFEIWADVIGDHDVYEVMVSFEGNEFNYGECSCPYNQGGFCKHIVGTLLAYKPEAIVQGGHQQSMAFKDSDSGGESPNRYTSTIYDVSISEDGTLDLAPYKRLISEQELTQKLQRIRNFEWKGNCFVVGLADYSYFQLTTVSITVKIRKRELSVKSSPERYVRGLGAEEVAALVFLDQKFGEPLQLFFNADGRPSFLEKISQDFGFDSYEEAKDFLNVDFKRIEEPVKLKDGYGNLVAIKDIRERFSYSNKDKILENVFSSVSRKENCGEELFFRIMQNDIQYNLPIVSVTPFIGKKKKNGDLYGSGLKPLNELPSYRSPNFTDEEVALIKACENTGSDEFELKHGRNISNIEGESEREAFVFDQNIEDLKYILGQIRNIQVEAYLQLMVGRNGKIDARYLEKVELVPGHPELTFRVTTENGIVKVSRYLCFAFGEYEIEDLEWVTPVCGRIKSNKLFVLSSGYAAIVLKGFTKEKGPIVMAKGSFVPFMHHVLLPLSSTFKIDIVSLPDNMSYEQITTAPGPRKIYLKELDKFILIRPFVTYGEQEFNVLESRNLFSSDNGNKLLKYNRDFEAEKQWLEEIRELHPNFQKNTNHDFLSIHFDDFVDDYWFLSFMEAMRESGVEVYGFNDFKNFKFTPHSPSIQVNASSGEDWFDLEITISVGDENISLKEVRKAIVARERYIKLGNGKLAVLPEEWIKKLEKYLRIGKVSKDGIQISKLRYNALDELFENLDQHEIVKEILEKKQKLKAYTELKKVAFPEMKASLRHYQEDGYNWLHFLHEFKWGGILADDMGLGKTLQMLTFLKSVAQQGIKTNLIVLPTSLLFNWQNEIEKFCPDLSYFTYYGADRDKEKLDWKNYDLVLTSYGLLVSDIEMLSKVKYGYVVLDESQAIKNPLSKRFKAVSLLKAYNRIAMTGTPIENNTFDLYSQMTFANPGIFISSEQFKKSYATPIDRYGDQEAATELNKIIHPFVLRRTKEMVAKELPPKTEDVIYCQMEPAQRKVYDAFRNQYRNDLLGKIESDGLESTKLHVLQAFIKLRQICNSPALLSDEENYGSESVKIKELVRHIRDKTGNHKLLIFSQFVEMLKLIKKELDTMDIDHSYLDGSTTQKRREKEVEKFQEQENVRVFLISLKAGGTGLNLMAADYVYIVDPWWNPAVENQAIDRCYRIGQDKKVIAYRMICKDTLEEKMMRYKQQKQEVAESIVKTDDHVMKQITMADVDELFS